MRLKIIRAPSMAEAMAQLRVELGPDALILSARTLRDGIEITAGLDTQSTLSGPAPAAGMVPKLPDRRTPSWPPAAPPAARPPGRRAPIQALAEQHGIAEPLARRMSAPTLAEGLERCFRFAPIDAQAGPLLFVGLPGSGKTSTVARLATRLVLSGSRPMVITADGRRAGATEQLAAYTRLLGLNLVVATHPVALCRAMTRHEPGASVLIDAPGCDLHDKLQMQEIAALADAVNARIALVLPAGLDQGEAADIAELHAAIGATLMVATRLDLARRLGSVLSAADAGQLALAEAGIGPGAADGLVPFTPALLVDRLERDLSTAPQLRVPAANEAYT